MFLNIKIIYKRLVITFIITFLIGCKSVSVDSEKVIEIYFNEVLSQSVLKRVQDHGIVLKEYDDYSWFINFMKNDPFKKNGVLENTKDSITREFFYQKNRDYYIKQFNSKKNKINKLNYNIEKLAMFSGSLKEKLKLKEEINLIRKVKNFKSYYISYQ